MVKRKVYVPVVRVSVNRYSYAYLNLATYRRTKLAFNYGLCSSYGYYNYNCIGYGTYTYNYWEPSMLSLCTTTGYVNSRCIGYGSYLPRPVVFARPGVVVGIAPRSRVIIRTSGGGGAIGGIVGLCVFCCLIGVIIGACRGGDKNSVEVEHTIVHVDEIIEEEVEYYEEEEIHEEQAYVMGNRQPVMNQGYGYGGQQMGGQQMMGGQHP